jgi:glycosyltransferase involved in cell wall biosynthesis
MPPYKVLHLRDTYEIGGPGKTILETHRAIDARRFQLHLGIFLAHGESEDSPFVTEARRLDLPVHFVRGRHSYDPCLIWEVARLVRTLDIDIVHAHEVKSDVIALLAARIRAVPLVTTMHGWIGNGVKQRCMTALDKRIVRGFDQVIAVSREIYEELRAHGVPQDRLRLVHNAIVVERYARTGKGGAMAGLLGKAVTHPVIASIGRLSAEKGHADLVEALALVKKAGQKFMMVFMGDGPERDRLSRQVTALGLADSVSMPGYIRDPRALMEEIDLMVLPSHTEGLPNAALEALLMEIPVLATGVGGTPEVIEDGATGRLVPSHAPERLAGAILEFLADPGGWKQMALRGREMVKERFDFQARTRKIEAIYSDVLRNVTV